jgi:molybdopterin converting factor small subunit
VLLARFPRLRELVDAGGMVLSVDGEYATGDTPLRDGAEVAVIPPISGG